MMNQSVHQHKTARTNLLHTISECQSLLNQHVPTHPQLLLVSSELSQTFSTQWNYHPPMCPEC